MGLDWTPASRAKPGHEKEHARLRWQLRWGWCSVRDSKQDRLQQISMSAAESLRMEHQPAPARELQEVGAGGMIHRFNGRPMGSFVDKDGDPWFYDVESGEQIEMMSFRAKALQDCIPIIGEGLCREAYKNKSAAELLRYADDLEKALARFDRDWRKISPKLFGRETDPMTLNAARVLLRAIDWCRFWGSRGHGIVANW